MYRSLKHVLTAVCMALLLVTGVWSSSPVFAGGSVLDTINQSGDEGQDSRDLSLESSVPENQPSVEAPPPEPVVAAPVAPVSGKGEVLLLTADEMEKIIQQVIQRILSTMGISSCNGVRIIIIRCPGTTSGSTTPTTPTEPATPAPTPIPTCPNNPAPTPTPSNPATSEGLKADMAAKYGIKAISSDVNWTQRQLEEANKVLDTLPEGFRGCTKNIQRDSMFQSPGVLGYVQMGIPTVHLLSSCCQMGTFQGTLVHEMTHCFQAEHPDITNAWTAKFWPNGRYGGPSSSSVSSYGNTQPVEDFAESVRAYWQNGPRMKQAYPDRYAFIQQYVMSGKEYS